LRKEEKVMNLHKHIRKVLRETVNESTFFRRRVDMRLLEKEFYENLNYSTDGFISKLKKGISFDFDVFKRIVMHNLMDDYHNDLSDGGLNEFPYDEIYEFLSDHFHDKIKDRYDLIVSRNINESKIPPSVNRRLHYVDEYINNLDPNDVCEYWTVDEVNEYTNGTLIEIIRTIIGDSSGIDSDNYGSIYDVIYEFLVNLNYPEQIRDFFSDSMDNCGDVLKEETKPGKYIPMIKGLTDEFKEKDCLCDIKISFDVEENYYDIYLVFSQEELHEKFFNLYGIRSYIQKMMNEVKMELESFLPIRNIFIGNYTKPNCEWSPLNESENKKSRLLTNIEENGLYNVMGSSGLHINQIEQKVGQLSREVLERFIIDVLKEHGDFLSEQSQTYVIDLESVLDSVPLGDNDYVERIRVTDNELSFKVMFYEEDDYGDLEETNWEIIPSKNLKYNNIYEIAGTLGYYLVRGKL
jgi:hypothetical protein